MPSCYFESRILLTDIDIDGQCISLDAGWSRQSEFSIGKRLARRINRERKDVLQETGLVRLYISSIESDRPLLIMRGNTEALEKAEHLIKNWHNNSVVETRNKLKVPFDQIGLLLGKGWSRWAELVVRCGGPQDPKLQSALIDM